MPAPVSCGKLVDVIDNARKDGEKLVYRKFTVAAFALPWLAAMARFPRFVPL